jgi:hypothetical protein
MAKTSNFRRANTPAQLLLALLALGACHAYSDDLRESRDRSADDRATPDAAVGSDDTPVSADACSDPQACPNVPPLGACGGVDCCQTDADCESIAASVALCTDPSACQGRRWQAQCIAWACVMDAVEDDRACDGATVALQCDEDRPLFCSGGVEQPAPACDDLPCVSDAECDPASKCEHGACTPGLPDGAPCDGHKQCNSAHCAGETCCRSGQCCQTDDDCPVQYTCADPQLCQGLAVAQRCGAEGSCEPVDDPIEDDRGCVEQVARACGAYRDVRCTAGVDQEPEECADGCKL